MIEINLRSGTYVCPYCGHDQAFMNNHDEIHVGFHRYDDEYNIRRYGYESEFDIHCFQCANQKCRKICLTSFNRLTREQFDILPEVTFKHYPNYIPEQIRQDYEEACTILEKSPKAAATLYRRCLQGMIRDFWGITKSKLIEEIEALRDKVSPVQWKAIDGLRKIGNIGAHMEKDVNMIVDIEPNEAKKLQKLIELLMEQWYVARHDEEMLLTEIADISNEKESERKNQ